MSEADGADFVDNPLWAFSLQQYARNGVKEACLELQDEHGLDVNIALACLWHERRGGAPLSSKAVQRLLCRTADLRKAVYAIRTSRRAAKTMDRGGPLYRTLKRAELIAENLVQHALFEHLEAEPTDTPNTGLSSLEAYARASGTTLPPERVQAFAVT